MVALLPHAPASGSSIDQNDSRIHQQPEIQQENAHDGINRRKPRGKKVPSRYLSITPSQPSSSSSPSKTDSCTSTSSKSSTSRRFSSPLISRAYNSNLNVTTSNTRTPSSFPKRSQSVGRSRTSVVAGTNSSDVPAATKMLITSSRSLSVSFQGEAFSLPISKKKEAVSPVSNLKTTPDLRKSAPNPRTKEKQRFMGTTYTGNSGSNTNPVRRKLDSFGFGSELAGKSVLQPSQNDQRQCLDLGNTEELSLTKDDANSANELGFCVSCELRESDTDSISSGSTSDVQECDTANSVSKVKSLPRDFIASARFWQETNSRLRRLYDPGLGVALSSSPAAKINASLKLNQSKRFSTDAPMPSTQTKLSTSSTLSLSKALLGPCYTRNGANGQISNYHGNAPSILSFSADIRRGKIAEDLAADAHTLRLLYNHYLQWRIANAMADDAFMAQSQKAEPYLWNVWVSISELRHSVILKRIKLQLLRQKLKLTSVIKGQILYLEQWDLLDKNHSDSLSEATKALKASTLRLPVVGKAVVDIQALKDAIGSAVDVMQAMLLSIGLLSSTVEETNSVMTELLNITSKERDLLERCKNFLSASAAMQVTDCSLKTHLIQLSRVLTTEKT